MAHNSLQPLAPVAPPQVFYPVPLVTPPAVPPQFISHSYPPGGGAPMPPYVPAPVQPYQNTYPPAYWPQYLPYYTSPQGSFDKDLETAKPNKFTGWDPSKLRPLSSAVSWPLTASLASFQLISSK